MTDRWQEQNDLVIELMNSGKLEEAVDAAREAAAIAEQEYRETGEGDRLVVALNNLGELCHLSGDLENAGQALQRSLEMGETLYGDESPEIIETLMNLAELKLSEQSLAGHEQALRHVERVLDIFGHAPSPEEAAQFAREHARAIHLIVMILQGLGRFDEAKQHLQQGLKLLEEALGGDQNEYGALFYKSLGACELQKGDIDAAEQALRSSLKIFEVLEATEHPEFAGALALLSEIFIGRGHYEAGLSFMGQAQQLLQAALGEDHPEAMMVMERMAMVQRGIGDTAQAEKSYRQALAGCLKSLGEGDEATARVRNDLAELLLQQSNGQGGGQNAGANSANGMADEILDLLEASLKARKELFGQEHPAVAQTLNNLGVVNSMRGQDTIALKLHSQALAVRETVFGVDHPAITQSLENLAAMQRRRGDRVKAEELLVRCLDIWQKNQGDAHPAVAQISHNLATLYIESGRHEEAEARLKQARRILESGGEQNNPHLAVVFETMAELYRQTGRQADANEFAARVTKIRKPEALKAKPQG